MLLPDRLTEVVRGTHLDSVHDILTRCDPGDYNDGQFRIQFANGAQAIQPAWLLPNHVEHNSIDCPAGGPKTGECF